MTQQKKDGHGTAGIGTGTSGAAPQKPAEKKDPTKAKKPGQPGKKDEQHHDAKGKDQGRKSGSEPRQ